MKKKFFCLFIGIVFFLGCRENKQYESNNTSMLDSLEKQEEVVEVGIKEEYQLNSIKIIGDPHGGFYEFDPKKKQWCERPMMADVMSYMQIAGLEEIDEVPDLTNYFGKSATKDLNSCLLSINKFSSYKIVELNFKNQMVYRDSVSLETKRIPIKNPIVLFEEKDDVGSFILSDGKKYSINLDSIPNIDYSNQFCEVTLNFKRK